MPSIKSFFISTILLSLASSTHLVGKYTSLEGYDRWQGIWPGTDAHAGAKDAYDDMVHQGGTSNMMACATDNKNVFCASSAVGGATGRPYPNDFTAKAKKLLDDCARSFDKYHTYNARCAEPMLVNLLSAWNVDVPAGRVYIYGLGKGTTPQYHTPCLDRSHGLDGSSSPTHGCTDLLWNLGWEWYDPKGNRPPSPVRPPVSSGPSNQPTGPRRPSTPPQSAPPPRRGGSQSPTRHRKRSSVDDVITLELQIRDLIDELADDMGYLEVRDVYSNMYDEWDYI